MFDSKKLSQFEVGYIMGVVVGEGSFTFANRSGRSAASVLSVKLKFDDPAPLHELVRLLGGRLYGPYTHGGRTYLVWRLMGRPLRRAIPLFLEYLPESKKRQQFLAWLERRALHQYRTRPLDPHEVEAA